MVSNVGSVGSPSRVAVAIVAAMAALLAPVLLVLAAPRAVAQIDPSVEPSPTADVSLAGVVVLSERDDETGRFTAVVSVPGAPEVVASPRIDIVGADGEVRQAEATIEALDTPPTVVLVVDTSGSMQGARLEAARIAAHKCVGDLPTYTQVGMVAYSSEPHSIVEPTQDRVATGELVDSMVAAGETATFDAVVAGATLLPAPRPGAIEERASRFMILLTDGEDTVSVTPSDAAITALDFSGFQLYALGVDPNSEPVEGSTLSVLTEGSTGTLVTGAPEDLGPICRSVAERIASRYRVSVPIEVVPVDEFGMRLWFEDQPVDIPVPADPAAEAVPTPTPEPTAEPTPEPAPTHVPHVPPAAPEPGPDESAGAAPNRSPRPPISNDPPPEPPSDADRTAGTVRLWLGAGSVVGAPFLVSATLAAYRVVPHGIRPRRAPGLGVIATIGLLLDSLLERLRLAQVVDRRLERAGLSLRPGEFVAFVGMAAGVPMFGLVLLGAARVGIMVAAMVVIVAMLWLKRRTRKRSARFTAQLGDTLMLMSGALRAGHSTPQALSVAAEKAPSPNAEEFQRVVAEVRLGRDIVDSLIDMAARTGSEDAHWVAGAIGLNRELGGNLSATLDNVADTIAARAQIKSQVKVMSAEGRMTAALLLALPFVVSVMLQFLNPGYLSLLFEDPIGNMILAAAMGLMVAGGFWVSRLIKLEY